MRSAIIVFPASNCDRDLVEIVEKISGKKPHIIWHKETSLPENLDFIGIPGGFSFGDYLRSGAMAAHSPIMNEVIKQANKGVFILGICNGFQILTETGLLPGALTRNKNLKFLCKNVDLEVCNNQTLFTKFYKNKTHIKLPIAHHDGNFFADENLLKKLKDNEQIAFKYLDNPNGSYENIAGIFNEKKNILGLMPHPERAADSALGNEDGKILFESLVAGFAS